jgi:hypothetical protein
MIGEKYTVEELNARLKFFIGIVLGLTLFGIVFVVLYSLIFVTQPMNGMSPVDNKFFELIIPIATFLTGTLSGIMLAGGDKDATMKALEAATKPPAPSTPPTTYPTKPFMPTGGVSTPAPGFSLNMPLGSGNMSATLNTNIPDFTPQVITGFGGKPAPAQPPQPEI